MDIKFRFLRLKKKEKFHLMGDLVYKKLTRDENVTLEHLDKSSNQICYNRVYSANYCSFFIAVKNYPATMKYGLIGELRDKARSSLGIPVMIDSFNLCIPHKIKWRSNSVSLNQTIFRYKRKRQKKEEDKDEEMGFSDMGVDEQKANSKRLEYSWKYFQHCAKEDIATPLVSTIFRVRIYKEDCKYVKFLLKTIDEIFKDLKIDGKIISLYIFDLLDYISPFKHMEPELSKKLVASRVLSTKITSSLSPLTQGKLPKKSLILGNDISNHQEVSVDVGAHTEEGNHILFIASTGCGKSFELKYINEQIPALGMYLYITDFARTEYNGFGDAYGAKYLDLGSRDGKYFETLRLGEPTGVKELDDTIVSEAINDTYAKLTIMKGSPLTAGQKRLISDALVGIYNSHNVDLNDMNTYQNSNNIRIKELLPKTRTLMFSEEYRDNYGKDLRELVDVMEQFFNGIYSYMFENPISFNELKDERIIITKFGTDSSKSLTGEESVEIRLKQLTKLQLDAQLARYRRSKNQGFFTEYEEIPEYLKLSGSAELLEKNWLGIRKCNGICIGIINDPAKVESDLTTIVSNSKYVIVGKTEDQGSLEYIKKLPKLERHESSIKRLVDLEHCFLVAYDNVASVFRAELPEHYAKSDIYKTKSEEFVD